MIGAPKATIDRGAPGVGWRLSMVRARLGRRSPEVGRYVPRSKVRARAIAICGVLVIGPLAAQSTAPSEGWRQWGGPTRDFVVHGSSRLAESWPASGPRQIWSRPLGTGHSAILVDDGRLYTMVRSGSARDLKGPWQATEAVVALDAASGEGIWRYEYPSAIQDFSRGPGPHSTPLIVGDRLFAIGTNKQFHALDKRTGRLLWSHDLVADFGAPPLLVRPLVKSGYASSPIAYRNLVIAFVGGPGQSVMAFDQRDGSVVWKSSHFLISGSSPLLIDVDGETQLVCFGGALVAGLDPDDGEVLWVHPHDAGNDFNFSLPLWGDDQILFLSSGYRTGSRALRLRRTGDRTAVEERWFDGRVKFQFLNGVRVGDRVYGTTGQSGTAFLTAVDITSGETAWRQRGFGQSSMLYADAS